MILGIEKLASLPTSSKAKPLTFSADGKGTHRQGQVIEFKMADGSEWVGNFVSADERFGKSTMELPPILLPSAKALVFCNQYGFVVTGPTDIPKVLTGLGPWSSCSEVPGKKLWLLASLEGALLIIDADGTEKGFSPLECCEDLVLSKLTADSIEGTYYQFNLKKRVPFKMNIRDLLR